MNPKIYKKIQEKYRLLTDREILAEYLKISKKLEMIPEDVNVFKFLEYLDKSDIKKNK